MMETQVTEAALADVITTLADGFDSELYAKTREQLEEHWFFRFDAAKTMEANIYEFHDVLELYGSFCRRWEEHHGGICCVVERVRDRYLMPKIRQFADDLRRMIFPTRLPMAELAEEKANIPKMVEDRKAVADEYGNRARRGGGLCPECAEKEGSES